MYGRKTMSDDVEPKEFSEVEGALIDAFKTMLECMIHIAPGSQKYLSRSFAHQSAVKAEKDLVGAAAVFGLLRQFVEDPERQEAREQLAKFLSEEPKGRA
jgi:hypothetical protein